MFYRAQQSSLTTIPWKYASRLTLPGLLVCCFAPQCLYSRFLHSKNGILQVVLVSLPCFCLTFCFSFCARIVSSLLFVVMRHIAIFMTAHCSDPRTAQCLSSAALCVTIICKTLLLEASCLFMVPWWVQWHAMSCSGAQEQQETSHHISTAAVAGTLVLLKSLVRPIVSTYCRHGCQSTAHCCVTWPVKKPCGLEQ